LLAGFRIYRGLAWQFTFSNRLFVSLQYRHKKKCEHQNEHYRANDKHEPPEPVEVSRLRTSRINYRLQAPAAGTGENTTNDYGEF
jgi:hypothetical protein